MQPHTIKSRGRRRSFDTAVVLDLHLQLCVTRCTGDCDGLKPYNVPFRISNRLRVLSSPLLHIGFSALLRAAAAQFRHIYGHTYLVYWPAGSVVNSFSCADSASGDTVKFVCRSSPKLVSPNVTYYRIDPILCLLSLVTCESRLSNSVLPEYWLYQIVASAYISYEHRANCLTSSLPYISPLPTSPTSQSCK